jgi:biotin transport system substrate-specific component
MQQSHSHLSIRSMTLCALFTVLIVIGAWIRIPIPIVPFTLQTLFVYLSGAILGSQLGAVSTALYLVLGLVGLPVFTSGNGLFYIFQPTFGYILGFIFGAWTAGRILENISSPEFKHFLLAGSLCLAIIYFCGMAYYFIISRIYWHDPVSVRVLLLHFFLPPLPGDFVLCVLGAMAAKRIRPLVTGPSSKTDKSIL